MKRISLSRAFCTLTLAGSFCWLGSTNSYAGNPALQSPVPGTTVVMGMRLPLTWTGGTPGGSMTITLSSIDPTVSGNASPIPIRNNTGSYFYTLGYSYQDYLTHVKCDHQFRFVLHDDITGAVSNGPTFKLWCNIKETPWLPLKFISPDSTFVARLGAPVTIKWTGGNPGAPAHLALFERFLDPTYRPPKLFDRWVLDIADVVMNASVFGQTPSATVSWYLPVNLKCNGEYYFFAYSGSDTIEGYSTRFRVKC